MMPTTDPIANSCPIYVLIAVTETGTHIISVHCTYESARKAQEQNNVFGWHIMERRLFA
jgi:hypothetical protein